MKPGLSSANASRGITAAVLRAVVRCPCPLSRRQDQWSGWIRTKHPGTRRKPCPDLRDRSSETAVEPFCTIPYSSITTSYSVHYAPRCLRTPRVYLSGRHRTRTCNRFDGDRPFYQPACSTHSLALHSETDGIRTRVLTGKPLCCHYTTVPRQAFTNRFFVKGEGSKPLIPLARALCVLCYLENHITTRHDTHPCNVHLQGIFRAFDDVGHITLSYKGSNLERKSQSLLCCQLHHSSILAR